MAKRRRKYGDRQVVDLTTNITPTGAQFPIIPTEVFWELNPELQGFLENKPPQYFPSYYNYSNYGHFAHTSFKKNPAGCAPRRLCIPRPCQPV